VGAIVALVYVIGGASLALRYDGFGLPGHQAAAQTPREVLLAAGLRTLAVWAVISVAMVALLGRLPMATKRALARRLRRPAGMLAAAAVALALLLLLRVWWPLAAYAAVLVVVLSSVHWWDRPLARLLATVAAVAVVGVAYEADRLSYVVERSCVTLAQESGRVCGTLVGHQDRGFYLGVPVAAAGAHSPPQELVFIPAERVREAESDNQLLRVTTERADTRRARLPSRLWNLRVR
jgi:hypothetical protein